MTGEKRPNVIFVFSDQHRAQACGYAGDPNVLTPNMDRLAKASVNFTHAVSNMPVCCPYRASLITGQYAHTHGVFINDVCLSNEAVSIAEAYRNAGYQTGYIGKWHIDGHGRFEYIPEERRHGFEYWKVLECTHDYHHSKYFENTNEVPKYWEGYDAFAQTQDAVRYIKERDETRPFLLMLSWGPPHNPYDLAPKKYRDMYQAEKIQLRENVHPFGQMTAREELAGYYAHISALDDCLGMLDKAVKESGIEENTIFVYTSDHGDMLYSHGVTRKQVPWDESILVPFLMRYPEKFGGDGRVIEEPFGTVDIMPTLLDLCGIEIPETVEGDSYVRVISGGREETCALLQSLTPHGEWHKYVGGREYRGIRTRRYTYVRDLNGPWLCYDNDDDPMQLKNIVETDENDELIGVLDRQLSKKLEEVNDEFGSGKEYIKRWNYPVDGYDTIPAEYLFPGFFKK